MPFIVLERRAIIDEEGLEGLTKRGLEIQVGDMCYVHYKRMVEYWKANPRWTTAHEIYQAVMTKRWQMAFVDRLTADQLDYITARELAWQVFFQLHVMPYEEEKRLENGDIR